MSLLFLLTDLGDGAIARYAKDCYFFAKSSKSSNRSNHSILWFAAQKLHGGN